MNFTALYRIEVYDETTEENVIEGGVIPGVNNFSDAMAKIEDYYGADIIRVVSIDLFDVSVFHFKEEHFNTIETMLKEAEQ